MKKILILLGFVFFSSSVFSLQENQFYYLTGSNNGHMSTSVGGTCGQVAPSANGDGWLGWIQANGQCCGSSYWGSGGSCSLGVSIGSCAAGLTPQVTGVTAHNKTESSAMGGSAIPEVDTYDCIEPPPDPECAEGRTWSESEGHCVLPVPDCAPSELLGSFVAGDTHSWVCTPSLDGDVPETCEGGSGGTAGGAVYCDELEDLCQQNGGQLVIIAGVQSCLHDDDELDPPDCLGGINIWSNESGGFVCSPKYEGPYDPEVQNPVGQWNGPNGGGGGGPDTDGDGIPNRYDPDIDGDGIHNAVDSDVDGDGIPNAGDPDIDDDGIPNQLDGDMDGDLVSNGADNDIDGDGISNDIDTDDDGDGIPDGDDITPQGPNTSQGTLDDPYVQGGGNCDPTSAPVCTGGDALQCATIFQTWKTRCAVEEGFDLTEEIPNADLNKIENDNYNNAAGLIDAFGVSLSDAIGDGNAGISGPSGLSADIQSGILDTGTCSNMSFNWKGNTVAITCADTADLRAILAWVVSLYTLFAVFNLATRPAVAKG